MYTQVTLHAQELHLIYLTCPTVTFPNSLYFIASYFFYSSGFSDLFSFAII